MTIWTAIWTIDRLDCQNYRPDFICTINKTLDWTINYITEWIIDDREDYILNYRHDYILDNWLDYNFNHKLIRNVDCILDYRLEYRLDFCIDYRLTIVFIIDYIPVQQTTAKCFQIIYIFTTSKVILSSNSPKRAK